MRYEKENEHSNGSLIDDIGIMFHQLSMVTRVHKDGTVEKEVWALADSAFLAGDSNHNPFLFRLGKDWEVEELDSCIETDFFGETGKLNLKACKTRNGLEGMDFFSAKEKWMRPLAVPEENWKNIFVGFILTILIPVIFRR